MIRKYDPEFIQALKKADVRIRKSFKQRIAIFAQDPQNSQLNNHLLQKEYKGYRSIDIPTTIGQSTRKYRKRKILLLTL